MSATEMLPILSSPVPPVDPVCVSPELHAELLFALERGRPQLERVAMRMMRCREDAEDVLQESVLKALRFLPRFRGDARMDTWLHAIVLNTARDWLRSRRERPRVSLEADPENEHDGFTLDFPHPGENPEECCCRHELLDLLHEEIGLLDPVYQAPIRLCDLDGRSYREAAQTLKVSGPAIKARLFRGRVLLKGKLSQDLRARRGRGAGAAENPPRRRRRRRREKPDGPVFPGRRSNGGGWC